VQFTERFVYHRQHQYAGTFDALATYRKVPRTLIDFKTTANPDGSKSRREDYLLQVTAYAAALEDSHGVEVNQAVIIIAHPNGQALEWVLSREQMAQYWQVWLERLAGFRAAIATKPQLSEVFKW